MEEDIRNTKFHLKVTQITEENALLREEIAKLDDRNSILERQQKYFKRQLEQIHEKYSELQREYDEQKDILDEVRRKEKDTNIALQKSTKEQRILLTRLETVELEVVMAQEVTSLKNKLKKVTNERLECTKQKDEIVEKLDEKYNECESLLMTITDLKEANENLRSNYEARENMIKMLRENNRQLEDENAELKLLISMNTRTSTDKLSKMPHSNAEPYCTVHDIPYNRFNDTFLQDSLYDELKASGFTNICSWNDTISYELKKQVQCYELEIDKLIQQTECVFQQLVSGCDKNCLHLIQNINHCTESSEKMKNLEVLKQRIQILLDMVNTTSPEPRGIEIGIQVPAISRKKKNLQELSNLNEEDHLECFCKKNQIIASHDISKEKQDQFTISAKCPKVVMMPKSFVGDPIIQVLDKSVRCITSPRKKRLTENISLTRLERRKIHKLTFCKNSYNDAATKIRVDIMDDGNGDYTDNERFVPFMGHLSLPIDFSVTSKRVAITRNRKSKSESSLLPEKKALFCRPSFNAAMPLSAEPLINEAIEMRKKSFDGSTCEEVERVNKFPVLLKQNDRQNLTSSHGYAFGGTYRSLNDSSTDSSVSSSSLRSDNLLPQDFSIDKLEDRPFELHRPVHLAPMKLKFPSDKTSPFTKEQNLTNKDTQQADFAAASNKLLENIKSKTNIRETKQYKIVEQFEEGRLNRDYYNESPNNYLMDMNKEIYSINSETYLIDKLAAPICRDITSMYFRRFSNFDRECYTEDHLPAAYSTPMRIESKNKNSSKSKNKKDGNDNCESLVRRFADLEMSRKKLSLFRIYKDRLNEMNNEERLEKVDSGDGEETVSISLCSFANNSALSRSKCALTNRENSDEYFIPNVAQRNNTEGRTNCATAREEKIRPTSSDGESQMSDSKENFLDRTQPRKNLLEENKSILQVCKFYHSSSAKSKIVGEETRLRTSVSHSFTNIQILPSWRALIFYALVFFFGFYAVNIFLYVGPPYKWWSLEEILNRYFPITNTGCSPPI
ncbi:uncharacterized protein LOC118448986 isoform X1 [Vespa mandarinia]|uniref:uncharacterized protein LOC118448986 isoform X1 n=1 Tax=Vespa mandarinia TaxID=7446 RepID=UPI0016074393|nr:uncharacterized protein LOC118448986 isoform X1 [Vespa mandarinia]